MDVSRDAEALFLGDRTHAFHSLCPYVSFECALSSKQNKTNKGYFPKDLPENQFYREQPGLSEECGEGRVPIEKSGTCQQALLCSSPSASQTAASRALGTPAQASGAWTRSLSGSPVGCFSLPA